MNLNSLLQMVVDQGASDLHLRAGRPPIIRVHGRIIPMPSAPVLSREDVNQLVLSILSPAEQKEINAEMEVDLGYTLGDIARFRVNAFIEMGNLSASFRRIPTEIPSMEAIALPPVMKEICQLQRGLVLVTGPTGSGKTTSLAAMLDEINRTRESTILTIEDPVEFIHEPQLSLVRQREVGRDTHSFARALRAALRQDPDVILVGEMRDVETIETALTAAETGHLVFSTLHTRSAPSSINRIIDVFEAGQQQQVRTQLASALVAVMSQTLVPRADGRGRVAAFEVLTANDAVRNLIREDKVPQLRTAMQTGRQEGMQTMDASLASLVVRRIITADQARERAQDRRELERLIGSGARL